MKYWKRITDAGCPDSASAYDRKRALDLRRTAAAGRKKRKEKREKRIKLVSFAIHLPCCDVSPRHNFPLVFFAEYRDSNYVASTSKESLGNEASGVTSWLKSYLAIFRLENTNQKTRESGGRGKRERVPNSRERYAPVEVNGFATHFKSSSSLFAFNICLTFFPLHVCRDAGIRNVKHYSHARIAKYLHARWHLDDILENTRLTRLLYTIYFLADFFSEIEFF